MTSMYNVCERQLSNTVLTILRNIAAILQFFWHGTVAERYVKDRPRSTPPAQSIVLVDAIFFRFAIVYRIDVVFVTWQMWNALILVYSNSSAYVIQIHDR